MLPSRFELSWQEFVSDVERARGDLHCTFHGAWFRGQSNCDYELTPSLFRLTDSGDQDSQNAARAAGRSINRAKKKLRELLIQKKSVRQKLRDQYSVSNEKESEKSRARLQDLKAQISNVKSGISDNHRQVEQAKLLHGSEREAFTEFSFRSGAEYNSSWSMLAEMQHSGVPTRLLDWTEAFLVAVYFAVSRFRTEIEEEWNAIRSSCKAGPDAYLDVLTRERPHIPHPALFVMNPYHVSDVTTDTAKIWDLAGDDGFDYYKRFVSDRDWDFDGPIPIYSPQRTKRMEAQHGVFLVFGRSRTPLEHQVAGEFVRRVEMSRSVAAAAVWRLQSFFGMDHFQLFRDKDSLALRVRSSM